MLTIADCICRADQIVDEYLVRDNYGVALQLGIAPDQQVERMIAMGNRDGETAAADLIARWSDERLDCGDVAKAQVAIRALTRRLTKHGDWADSYDRAVRFEGSGHYLSYGLKRLAQWDAARLSGFVDLDVQIHHTIVVEEPNRPIRVAIRWSALGQHHQDSMFGSAVNRDVAILGASHFELRGGKIVNEWTIMDELSVFAQIRAGQKAD